MLRTLLILLTMVLGLTVSAVLLVSLLRIPIDLSPYRPLIESTASKALGREVKVDGDITVTTSLWPYFEIQNLRIGNPPGFPAGDSGPMDMAGMEIARVTVGLLPLLKRRINIREFRVTGINLNLVRTADGETNWVLGEHESKALEAQVTDAPVEAEKAINPDSLSVDKLLLENIHVRFVDAAAAPLAFNLARAEGGAPLGEPMQLDMRGELLDEAFTLKLKASSLAGFLAMTSAKLGLDFEIAGTRLVFTGRSEALRGNRSTRLKLVAKGADLTSLDDLLHLDLPPIKDYQITADLHATPRKLELSTLELIVKDSKLVGSAVVDRSSAHPVARINLTAHHIQLQDFDTGDWTAEGGAPDPDPTDSTAEASVSAPPRDEAVKREKLLSGEALRRADIELSVKVKEVLSGKDHLGSADLALTLRDGRIDLAPLHLQLPKATLLVKASLKPGMEASQASLRVLIENFDFGVLSRLSDPASKVGGTLNVDLDVSSYASNTNIMGGANGYFDISAQPTGLNSGIVDLWAVNLLSSVVTSAIKDQDASTVNCVVSRFNLENGVMTAQQLAVDTSRIRICGEGQLSFADRDFKLVAEPKAKRAEFFGLATPLKIKGEFDDFRVSMKGGALTLGSTAVKFVISPVTTPFKRLFQKDLPVDGADICGLPIGPRTQQLQPLPGC